MAQKMQAECPNAHTVLLYENTEGGHGGAADPDQAAYMQTLAYSFLHNQLSTPATKL
jgi:prolyl oligopeptidase